MSTPETPQRPQTLGRQSVGHTGLDAWLATPVFGATTELICLRQEAYVASEKRAAAEREASELRLALEDSHRHVAGLIQQVEICHQREKELRENLLQVHDQLLRRDEELRQSIRLRAMLAARLRQILQRLPRLIYRGVRKVLTYGKK